MSLVEKNYFSLFALKEQYAINLEKLKENYLKLQQHIHPDQFVEAGEHAKRLAIHYAAEINQAYRTLHDPILRAIYLLKLKGLELKDETTSLSSDFLMEQMELREKLTDASNFSLLKEEVTEKINQLINEVATLFETRCDLKMIVACIHKMQFYEKLNTEIEIGESTWHS